MNIKIDKGVPIPDSRNRSVFYFYFLEAKKMEIGDSFEVPSHDNAGQTYLSIRFRELRPKKFITRRTTDETIRVWRVE